MAITTKADVYSNGMMLFEIISGERNSDGSENFAPSFIPLLAACEIEWDEISLLDHRLEGDADLEEVS